MYAVKKTYWFDIYKNRQNHICGLPNSHHSWDCG
ncbi:unnamed protein product [Brassica oleracea]